MSMPNRIYTNNRVKSRLPQPVFNKGWLVGLNFNPPLTRQTTKQTGKLHEKERGEASGNLPSHIARKANVSSLPFYEAIEGLTKSGLLTKQEIGKSTFYKTSSTGREFIKKYYDLLLMVKTMLDASESFIGQSDAVK